ncbi:MAG TPA: hypothetical protein VF144_19880 [Chitinophagaceae bacterium]
MDLPKKNWSGWKIKDMAYAGDSIIGTATFSQTNTLVVKTIIRGKTVDSVNGSYELSNDNKFLTTKLNAKTSKFEKTKLTKDILELKGEHKMNTTVYIRYED